MTRKEKEADIYTGDLLAKGYREGLYERMEKTLANGAKITIRSKIIERGDELINSREMTMVPSFSTEEAVTIVRDLRQVELWELLLGGEPSSDALINRRVLIQRGYLASGCDGYEKDGVTITKNGHGKGWWLSYEIEGRVFIYRVQYVSELLRLEEQYKQEIGDEQR